MGKVERKVYNYNYQSMLFTKATENGIKLENAILLSQEQLEKVQIPANNARISGWAKDNHVNVMFDQNAQSDFNCNLGIAMETEVSESVYNANKKMLKHLGDELLQFIANLPSNVDDAADEAIIINEINKATEEYSNRIKEIAGEYTFVSVRIFKLKEHE